MEKLRDSKKMEYIQISRFLLDKRASEPRDEVHNILFEMGIFSNMKLKEWLSLEQIRKSIAYEIGLDTYPLEPLKRAASRLLEENRIKMKETENVEVYALVLERKEEFKKSKTEIDELHKKITNYLVEKIEKEVGELNRKDNETACEIFDLTLTTIFTAMENVSTTILCGAETKSDKLFMNVPKEYRKNLRKISDAKVRKSISNNIKDIIHNPLAELKKYFLYCANTSFIVKLLNLDPECQVLEKGIFSDFVLFLDTNVLISALYPAHELHEITHEVLKESNRLGVQLKVTSRTLAELDRVLNSADNIYSKTQRSAKSRFYIPENTIIETFVRYAEIKGDTWQTFLLASKRQTKVMDRKYNIQLDETNYLEHIDKTKLEDLSKIVKECSERRQYPKSKEVSEHDAYHFLVTDYLREGHKFQKNIWFLSHDRTFDCVNKGFFNLEGKAVPCSVLCSSWMEVLFPFLSPDMSNQKFEDIFIKFVASDFFSMTKSLSFGSLTRFIAPFFDDVYLDEEDFIAILQDQILNNLYVEWKKADYSLDYDNQIAEIIAKLVDKRKDEKIKKLDDELKSRTQEIEKISNEVTTMKVQLKSSGIESKEKLRSLDKKVQSLKTDRDEERKKSVRTRRLGEIFIGVMTVFVVIIMLLLLKPQDILIGLEIIGSGALLGGLILGIYRWLTKEYKELIEE